MKATLHRINVGQQFDIGKIEQIDTYATGFTEGEKVKIIDIQYNNKGILFEDVKNPRLQHIIPYSRFCILAESGVITPIKENNHD